MNSHNNTAPAEVLIGAITAAVLLFFAAPEILRAAFAWFQL